MRFSILTVTLNAERFLQQTLESVAGQTGSTFEHLIWDGGSCDGTLSIIRSFKQATLIEGRDQGIADAMNRVASYAKGEYLLFLHADDLLAHKEVLLSIDRVLRLHPPCEWIYGRAHIIDEGNHRLRTTPYERFSTKRLRKYNFITHPATFLSKSLFQRVGGFHIDLRYCMDYDLWLRLSQIATPLALSTPLALFREHRGSLSTSEPLKVAQEVYQVRNRYLTSPYERMRSYYTWKKRVKSVSKNTL